MQSRTTKTQTLLLMVNAMCQFVGSLDEGTESPNDQEVSISLADAKHALEALRACAEKQLLIA